MITLYVLLAFAPGMLALEFQPIAETSTYSSSTTSIKAPATTQAPSPSVWDWHTLSSQPPTTTSSIMIIDHTGHEAVCELTSATLWDGFLIRGDDKYWDPIKLGRDNGQKGLLDNLRHCGIVSDWGSQNNHTGDQDWVAWGKLPWPAGEKCIPAAIKAAGGPDIGHCRYLFVEQHKLRKRMLIEEAERALEEKLNPELVG